MEILSKMATKCQSCPDRDKCDHKRMELCAYIDNPKATATASIPNEINISMGVGDIAKEIEKSIRRNRHMNCRW